MGFFYFKSKENRLDRNNCKTCQTNCLDETLSKHGMKFFSFPDNMQQKIEQLRELFVKINQVIENENNYILATKLKEQALEVYVELCGMMKDYDLETIAESFGATIELMMQRHMNKKAYEFINS